MCAFGMVCFGASVGGVKKMCQIVVQISAHLCVSELKVVVCACIPDVKTTQRFRTSKGS